MKQHTMSGLFSLQQMQWNHKPGALVVCGSGPHSRHRGLEAKLKEKNRIALVTGGGTGIGRLVATGLLERGDCVILAGRRPGPLLEVAAGFPDQALAVPTDVGNSESVVSLFEKIKTEFGRLDLLFNNAGIGLPDTPIEEVKVEQWQAVVDVNITGAFLCAREAFRIMKAQKPNGGRIINNGAVSTHVPRPHSVAYTATKHAVTGLTRSLALDGRAFGIACGQIDIGNAGTQLNAYMSEGVLQPDGSVRQEPTIDASNVADAILYMANLPLDANVLSMTVMATQMPLVGRG